MKKNPMQFDKAVSMTNNVESDERLKDFEVKSRAWLEHSPVCTKIVDLDLNLQYMSHAGIASLKIEDITKFYGKPYPLDIYPGKYRHLMLENLENARETGEISFLESPVLDVEGNELWYQATFVPVKDDKGEIEYIIIVSINITERKRVEEDLAKHHNYLEKMVEERTTKLQEEITERKMIEGKLMEKMNNLEKFEKLTVGREIKMIEMKKQVNALSKELGRPEPYTSYA